MTSPAHALEDLHQALPLLSRSLQTCHHQGARALRLWRHAWLSMCTRTAVVDLPSASNGRPKIPLVIARRLVNRDPLQSSPHRTIPIMAVCTKLLSIICYRFGSRDVACLMD